MQALVRCPATIRKRSGFHHSLPHIPNVGKWLASGKLARALQHLQLEPGGLLDGSIGTRVDSLRVAVGGKAVDVMRNRLAADTVDPVAMRQAFVQPLLRLGGGVFGLPIEMTVD